MLGLTGRTCAKYLKSFGVDGERERDIGRDSGRERERGGGCIILGFP